MAPSVASWKCACSYLLCSMPGHTQYTLGPVTCIDNVVDNDRVEYHQMASYFTNMRRRKTKRRNRTSNFELTTAERCARDCNCFQTHIPRNGHTLWPSECDDYAAVCDNAAMKRCPARVFFFRPANFTSSTIQLTNFVGYSKWLGLRFWVVLTLTITLTLIVYTTLTLTLTDPNPNPNPKLTLTLTPY